MAETTLIPWCDHTFNPWIGCTKISDGCVNCYASVETFTRVQRAHGRELWGPKADRHITSDANWAKPRRWNMQAEAQGVRRRVFTASLADIFEDRSDLVAPRDRLFEMIARTDHLDWLVLTKRPGVAVGYFAEIPPRSNLWVGTSVENQKVARPRIEALRKIDSVIRFLSVEPLLGYLDLNGLLDGIDWVIVGGESGINARACSFHWIRDVVETCKRAGVPVFVKQAGAKLFEPRENGPDHYFHLADSHGGDPSEWPEDLRIREFPTPRLDRVHAQALAQFV